MKKVFYLWIVLALFPLSAEGSEWLGEYVGGMVPGSEVLSSQIVFQDNMWNTTAEFDSIFLLNALRKNCDLLGGKAIINLRFLMSLGEISFRDKKSGMKITSAGGVQGGVYGDCVTSIRHLKK